MSAKQSIFISSVQKELALERRAVKDFIHTDPLLSRFFEVFRFEDLPAADPRADAVYLSEVDRCTIYLALFGNDYGFEDAQGISPTEREFDRATTLGKPRLIYVRSGDDSARHPKMRALVRKAGDQLIRRRFGDTPELISDIHASLVEHLARTGALRTSPFDPTACADATLADISQDKLTLFLARAQSNRGYALDPATPIPFASLWAMAILPFSMHGVSRRFVCGRAFHVVMKHDANPAPSPDPRPRPAPSH